MFRSLARRRAVKEPVCQSLLACPICGHDRVCPIDWKASGQDHWWLLLRCGDCDVWIETVITNKQAAALDIELNRQQAQIAAAADELDARRMAGDVETFVSALRLDLIDAADFARHP